MGDPIVVEVDMIAIGHCMNRRCKLAAPESTRRGQSLHESTKPTSHKPDKIRKLAIEQVWIAIDLNRLQVH